MNAQVRYGRRHRELRAREAMRVATGAVRCARGALCRWAEGELGGFIRPDQSWDLGHDDRDPSRYVGPEHSGCNRATKSHQPPRRRPDAPHPGLL